MTWATPRKFPYGSFFSSLPLETDPPTARGVLLFTHGQCITSMNKLTQGQFIRGQFIRGQFIRGQFIRGQFIRGQFILGG